ncbi:Ubiquitin-conjugating enzyme E2 Z [Frankliniella fusca]|uniref:Ubiquitin-conjugating enzyme E2 Z n=1 Tax=Frankliniella fusca TaxID=407009 RepID=A0AAE1H3T6_9NEOP|nr:Ubiquitin-conjugating enzyme E2 Z [Frankliniella fusca]
MAPPKAKYRIKRDIKTFLKCLPYGITGVPDESDLKLFHALIIGPDKNPFPDDYPLSPPNVRFMTTGGGSVRLHPNPYASGKVCRSLLGTWPGPSWSAAQSLSSVLISIQSLMDENPYHNEPVHEKEREPGAANQYN